MLQQAMPLGDRQQQELWVALALVACPNLSPAQTHVNLSSWTATSAGFYNPSLYCLRFLACPLIAA